MAWKTITLFATVAVLSLSGCSAEEDPVCDALKTVEDSVSSLGDVSLEAGALAELQTTVSQIETDLKALGDAAEQELGDEVDVLGTALTTLAGDVETAVGSPSADTIAAVGSDVAAVQGAWQALKDAKPDC